MSKIIFDYRKCKGSGECVEACPVGNLEISKNKRWCKPIDDKVENKEAVKDYYEKVEEKAQGEPDIAISFEVPDCVMCKVCVESCPEQAITVEE